MATSYKVAHVATFSREGKIESVHVRFVDADGKPAKISTFLRSGDGLRSSKTPIVSDEISFGVTSFVAQLVALNKDIAELRDQDYLTTLDFKAILADATITLDVRAVKAGDLKTDYLGRPIYRRTETGLVMLDEKLKPVQATYDADASIKDVVGIVLNESALAYIRSEVKVRSKRNNLVADERASLRATAPELIKMLSDAGFSKQEATLKALELFLMKK